MLKEHCFDRKYVIEPYGTIFATLVTKGLKLRGWSGLTNTYFKAERLLWAYK